MPFRNFIKLTLLLLITSCSSSNHAPPAFPPQVVTDYVIEPRHIPLIFDFVGFTESSHPVEIRARVEGYLDEIAYNEGKLVHENDLLFQLDPRQYEARVEQAKGIVAKEKAILENAKLSVNRLKPLYEQKAASKKDLDNALATLLAAEASLQTAQAQLDDAQLNLDYTTIRSPITGFADKSRFREGALINPGANSLLTTVSSMDPIWVYFTVSDNDILYAEKQRQNKTFNLPEEHKFVAEVVFSDGTTYQHKGMVDFSSPTYEQSTGTLLARAVFPNPDSQLRPGQFLRIKLHGAERPNAIAVPQRALLQKKGGLFVYLIDKENNAIAQDVDVDDWSDDFQIITNGLKQGDRIIVDGINKIRPGGKVQVIGPWTPNKK